MDRIHSFCDGELPPPRDVLLRKVEDIEGLLSLLTEKVDGELFSRAPKLKVVSNCAVGFDNIDIPEATKHGIIIGNTPGVLTETTADFAFALLMAAARRVVEGDKIVRSGGWKTWGPMTLLGYDIYGSTLGIIGLGRIGMAVATRAKGFGMKLLYYDLIRRKDVENELGIKYVGLDTLLKESDFVTIHTNLTPETRHLIGAKQFAMMKKTSVLINDARGPIVDNNALYEALRDGKIGFAGLDVTEPEPIPSNHPLLTLDNVIITPHIASASVETRTKMGLMAAENLIAGLKGEMPPNPVNPEVLKRK
jgi:glyoxylate reductase